MNHPENETEAYKRPIRTDGSYAQESASRFTLQAVCREGDVADKTPARENSAAGGILEGDAERDRVLTSERRAQWQLGVEGELQRGGACLCRIRADRPIDGVPQAKLEPGPSGLPGLDGADVKTEDVDDDEDEDDEDMEEVS